MSLGLSIFLSFRSSISVLLWESTSYTNHGPKGKVDSDSVAGIVGAIKSLKATDSPLRGISQSVQCRACDPPQAAVCAVLAARSSSVVPALFFLPSPAAELLAAARLATLRPSETTALITRWKGDLIR